MDTDCVEKVASTVGPGGVAWAFDATRLARYDDTEEDFIRLTRAIEQNNLGLDYVDKYPALINAVTAADVQRVAQKYLHPDTYALAVVADLTKAKFKP